LDRGRSCDEDREFLVDLDRPTSVVTGGRVDRYEVNLGTDVVRCVKDEDGVGIRPVARGEDERYDSLHRIRVEPGLVTSMYPGAPPISVADCRL